VSRTSVEAVRVKAGDAFTLRLPAVPAAGFGWQASHDGAALELLRGGVVPAPGAAPGAAAEEEWVFRALAAGETALELSYGRPWEAEPRERRTVRVIVEG
jgi:predicted secreted protein